MHETYVPIDDEWRSWIAENLMLECHPGDLIHAMISRGIDPEDAAHEMETAQASPYVRGAQRLKKPPGQFSVSSIASCP
jgi:hypothetical protein